MKGYGNQYLMYNFYKVLKSPINFNYFTEGMTSLVYLCPETELSYEIVFANGK
jgi:hypothetical protein